MKQVKWMFLFGIIVLALVGTMVIQQATPSRTVDFRGEIHKVVISEEGAVTVSAISVAGGEQLFRIDESSVIENCCGEKITADELMIGASVDINYRKELFKEEKVQAVMYLKMYEMSNEQ